MEFTRVTKEQLMENDTTSGYWNLSAAWRSDDHYYVLCLFGLDAVDHLVLRIPDRHSAPERTSTRYRAQRPVPFSRPIIDPGKGWKWIHDTVCACAKDGVAAFLARDLMADIATRGTHAGVWTILRGVDTPRAVPAELDEVDNARFYATLVSYQAYKDKIRKESHGVH